MRVGPFAVTLLACFAWSCTKRSGGEPTLPAQDRSDAFTGVWIGAQIASSNGQATPAGLVALEVTREGSNRLRLGVERPTTFVSAGELRAPLAASDLTSARVVPVTVTNVDGQTSQAATFEVRNPLPTLTSTLPGTVEAGAPAATAAGAVAGPDEQNVSQPLAGLGAGGGYLVVPGAGSLTAWKLAGP